MKLTFTVPGDPQPWQRPIHTRGGQTFTPKDSKDYQRMVGQYARIAMIKAGWRMTQEQVVLTADFIVPDNRRRDTDNLIKNIGDALNGVALKDDCQIVEIHGTKRVAREGEKTGATVTVCTADTVPP